MADNMTPAQRSRTMSLIRSKNTQPELTVRRLLHGRGLHYRLHVSRLLGKPDIVFSQQKIAVFIDGDYWHGWRFANWADTLSPYWRQKIARNRKRDRANHRRLRRTGWTVIRVWEHEVKSDPKTCVDFIEAAVRERVLV
jgi:DNA mismatch endonuclease (patch repair protein)